MAARRKGSGSRTGSGTKRSRSAQGTQRGGRAGAGAARGRRAGKGRAAASRTGSAGSRTTRSRARAGAGARASRKASSKASRKAAGKAAGKAARTGARKKAGATARKAARKGARKGTRKAASPRGARAGAGAASARVRPFRLPAGVRPTAAELHVELDPAQGDAYRGRVVHHLRLDRRRRSLELHGHELRVSGARVEAGGRRLRGRIVPHPERQTLEIELDEPVPAGEVRLELGFRGRLRGDLRGLYKARSGERRYAFTQLEAADARHFFPCFDEPALKARFRISVTTASAHTVLSNAPVAKVEPLGGGRKTVHFEPTPPLSTYLLALAVGELVASEPAHVGDTEIRVWHVPGKERLTGFGLECARETLARLEAWFDLPYPYEKLDLVAVPDFEAGAMENAGAVFFRETLLLIDPETATLQEKKRVAEVVCHELAHMWYGDLVTMAWWDDLWLNEAFATWMAFHVVDRWRPEWRMWNDFQHARAAAMGMDALVGTHPVYARVRTPDEATENFDLITYEKGASVVRMMERYLGEEAFRAGVRRYIRAHREGSAVAADLWRALEESSGRDVAAVVRSWIEQPGFPLLRVRRREEDGRTVVRYAQERFTARPARRGGSGRGASGRGAAAPATWPVPWVGRLGQGGSRSRTERHLIAKARGRIEISGRAPRFLYANADEGGFFRPLHEAAELEAIAAHLPALSTVERMGLVGHQWAHVKTGRAPLASFLDLALAFREERDPDVLIALRGPLDTVVASAERVLAPEDVGALRGRIAESFGPALDGMGLDAGPRESDEERLRRAALIGLVGLVAERPDLFDAASERVDRYLADRRAIDPNLADVFVALAAARGNGDRFDRYRKAGEAAATPQERRRFLMALGAFREPGLVDRALALSLTDSIGTQDVAILLTRLLANRAGREKTWEFMKRRWSALRRRMPPMLVTRPIEATPALGTRAHRRDVAAFFRAHPVPTGARAVRQALEQFDLTLDFDARAAPALRRWLAAKG